MSQLNKEAEEVLEVFTEYLNLWHAKDAEMGWAQEPVTRADYDDEQYHLFPSVLMDHIEADQNTRIIRIQADPFGGEGGPNILTAFFSDGEQGSWTLDFVLQEFDTLYYTVFSDGLLRGPDDMVKRG